MAMGLSEGWHDLRHFKAEGPVSACQGGAMAVGIAFVTFGRMRPDLDTDPFKRGTIPGATDRSSHPEAASADTLYKGCAGAVVVGTTAHCGSWRKALRTGGHQQAAGPGGQQRACQGTPGQDQVAAGMM
jgi:hypothetical protein